MALYLLVCIIILVLLAFIPIQVHITYQRINNTDEVKIKIKILFITLNKGISTPISKIFSLLARKKYTTDNIKESLQAEKMPERNWGIILRRINIWVPRGVQIMSNALKLTSRIFKPIRCIKLNIYTEVGLSDASKTSLAFGSLWGVYGFLVSQLSKWMILKPETPTIKIIPDFSNPKLRLEYDCIITFPLGHIIIVCIQTVRFLRISTHLMRGISS